MRSMEQLGDVTGDPHLSSLSACMHMVYTQQMHELLLALTHLCKHGILTLKITETTHTYQCITHTANMRSIHTYNTQKYYVEDNECDVAQPTVQGP